MIGKTTIAESLLALWLVTAVEGVLGSLRAMGRTIVGMASRSGTFKVVGRQTYRETC